MPTIPLEKVPLPPHLPDTKEMRSDWVIYADVMQALDKRIGKDIKQILESEHADNTIIFYFSDHGGILPRAKRYIFNTGTQVPFMVYLPKKWEYLSKFKPGSKTDDVVSFVDLASTVLNIAGAKIPDSMHGQPFLGENVSPKKYAYLFSQRFDEQIFKFSRGLTDGKVRYTKNFHPHRDRAIHGGFAHGQAGWLSYFNLYKKNKLNNITGLIWQPTQPKEELFDVTKDPWEVNNLITPENRPVKADDLSKALFSKMLETRDTGIVPEMMYGEISKSSTIYDYVNAEEFPYEEALSLAWQAVSSKDLHLALLKSSQPVIRYWAVMQCSIDKARGAELVDALLEMKGEQTPAVKIALVEALHHLGKTKDANTILLETLKARTDDLVRIEGLKLATITGVADEWDNETWNSFCKGSGYASRRKRK